MQVPVLQAVNVRAGAQDEDSAGGSGPPSAFLPRKCRCSLSAVLLAWRGMSPEFAQVMEWVLRVAWLPGGREKLFLLPQKGWFAGTASDCREQSVCPLLSCLTE